MTYDDAHDRIGSVVTSTLPTYQQAISNFSFDLQPHQESDRAYRYTVSRDRTEGYLGPYQAEIWRVEVWITRRINRNPNQAESYLRADLITLEDAILSDSDAADYNIDVDSTTTDVQSPDIEAEYIVGRLVMVLDTERAT